MCIVFLRAIDTQIASNLKSFTFCIRSVVLSSIHTIASEYASIYSRIGDYAR